MTNLKKIAKRIVISDVAPLRELNRFIIQQIVTMPIYGKEALNICQPT